jgi:hypothetical protein
MSAVHARIPMVMPDEVRALQIENAETLERQWSVLQANTEDTLAGRKAMAITTRSRARSRPPNRAQ